jgi:hypothetical protein
MKQPDYWKRHYVTATDPDDIGRAMGASSFVSDGRRFDLLRFHVSDAAPNILVSQGSGGHSYVFAELAYRMSLLGNNVFVMPKHEGAPLNKLVSRHLDAIAHIRSRSSRDVAIFGEGLGAYVAFYLALGHAPIESVACENGPAILTDPSYHRALLTDGGAWSGAVRRRRLMLPIGRWLVRFVPSLPVPISSYLDWKALVEPGDQIEARLVDSYLRDPDFDRWYPLSSVMSLVATPPPGPVSGLAIPTLFLVARRGPTPAYIRALFARLPGVAKTAVDIDGGVYWMLSHPDAAARILCDWFARSRSAANALAEPDDGGPSGRDMSVGHVDVYSPGVSKN